ncbi:hypothetical protein [Caldicellulosiruptor morganii]|uniref:Uncharacterized protein n=1 Tax=Caldicellulosiruptor morganii TaxID=1387555 RepID=A0ABY7BJN0_9FIRM|nr:hypothetical protein [Caldicellulosiruptor morganii]WAM33042.1 hypothetical protein OTK00_001503 [Caldicellulosiruptor morganii]
MKLQEANLKAVVGCVTMASIERLKNQIKKFDRVEGLNLLEFYGRENLLKIRDNSCF